MKKVFLTLILFILSICNISFAGQLTQVGEHFCYLQDEGTYATNKWINMDINADGINESYYFDASGFLLVNTITPDGYRVNELGQWIKDIPQVKKDVSTTNTSKPTSKQKNNISNSDIYGDLDKVWVCDTGKKYHTHSSCSKMVNPYQISVSEAESRGYTRCRKNECYGR